MQIRAGTLLGFTFVVCALNACAGQTHYAPAQQQLPFAGGRSLGASGSSSFSAEDGEYSSSGKGKALVVPHRQQRSDGADLTVRPDTLMIELAIRDVRPTAEEALAAVSKTSLDILEKINQATAGSASLHHRGVSANKVFRSGKPDEHGTRHRDYVGVEVTVDGHIEIRMGKDLDFWARSRLFVTLLELTARLSEQAEAKEEPLRSVSFANLRPVVKDPEAYRTALMERWIARARAFATLAQAKQAPLFFVDCAPPNAIAQVESSLEEVTLQLPIRCRIDVSDRPMALTPTGPNDR
jgi:hypothetical protein